MNQQHYSPKLKMAMVDIVKVMKRNDIGGVILLSDGHGHNEYRLQVTEPSWSTLKFLKDKTTGALKGLHFQAYMKTKREHTQATTAMVYGIKDLLAMVFGFMDGVTEQAEKHMDITHERGPHTPGV